MKTIPVVILCGGMGTRLAEITEIRPKPLVEIGGRPILWHIMKHYSHYGFNEFVLALGYKGEQIKRYFLDFVDINRDFSITLEDGQTFPINHNGREPWTVHLIDTGQGTMTGGRLKKLQLLIGKSTFMMTYGDGVSDVNLEELLNFHRRNKSMVTLTAVRSPARFGALEINGNYVQRFQEKAQLNEGWINGGFFVIEPEALDYIDGDVMWEQSPMEQLAEERKIHAYKHEGFWQCMDNIRDLRYLESIWESKNVPWKTWDKKPEKIREKLNVG